MKRIMAVALLALTLAFGVTTGAALADPDMDDSTTPVEHVDREGNVYRCLHYDNTAGCLYQVDKYFDGYMLYFVSPEGDRYRRWLPTEMVAGDPYESHTRTPTNNYSYVCPDGTSTYPPP